MSSLPNGMDRILKQHFDSYRMKGEMPPELRERCANYRLFGDLELLRVWRNNLRGLRYQDESGLMVRGAVDEILVKPGKLIVLDFKTRGFPRKEDTHVRYQGHLDLYNLLLRKNGYLTENYSYLLFYHPLMVEKDGNFVFNADLVKMDVDVENGLALLRRAADVLRKSSDEVVSSKECAFCSYRKA